MTKYIYQVKGWPDFTWHTELVTQALTGVRYKQGRVIGRMEAMGFGLKDEAMLRTMTTDIIKTNEIEGEMLEQPQVRSSLARHLRMDVAGLVPSSRDVDGMVEMVLDATRQYKEALTAERLFIWHSLLFPTGHSGNYAIKIGSWRDGPMQVVSGPVNRVHVHYEAPAAGSLDGEMQQFFTWFNGEHNVDPVLMAAIAHFWFVTIHPFDDGNGRIARAIADMQLCRADGLPQRYYSMSAQILKERNAYYNILEQAQKGTLNITGWLVWFLNCLDRALDAADDIVGTVTTKAKFWDKYATVPLNDRQRLMLNKLLDGFDGKLNSGKWAKIAKCSTDTALRDIQDLVSHGILQKEEAGGRSTSYVVANI